MAINEQTRGYESWPAGGAENTAEELSPTYTTYYEIDRHNQEITGADTIEQLRANLSQLEDLHGQLNFTMSEIKGLVKTAK